MMYGEKDFWELLDNHYFGKIEKILIDFPQYNNKFNFRIESYQYFWVV